MSYKLWHEYLFLFPKSSKYSLGSKLDIYFIETTEYIFTASHKSRDHKLLYIIKASEKLDLVKFFLQIAWEIKAIDNKKYIALSKELNEIGRMLGGWLKQTKTPVRSF